MPANSGTPDLVRHCVAAVAKEYGGDTNRAFAICVAQLQKAGYLKAGTMELTAAGKKKEKEHEAEPDFKKKMASYEKLLKAAREESVEVSESDWGSSDQTAMNNSIHRELGKPKSAPTLGAVLDAAEGAVEHYWGEWPEYRSDRQGLVMDAARKYYKAFFPDFMAAMRKFMGEENLPKQEAKTPASNRKLFADFIWKKTHKDFKGTEGGRNIMVRDPKTGGSTLAYLDKMSDEELQKRALALGYEVKHESADFDDFDRLVSNPIESGFERLPHGVSRKYESVTRHESSMDTMRRLAGITPRHTDRTK